MSKSAARTWFSAKALGNSGAEIVIYDEIGAFGITSRDFHEKLRALGDVRTISLRINSPGGDTAQGFAIFNMLQRHPATINVTIDGLAASMASVIAMVGDTVAMPLNAMMMIHDPVGIIVGDSKDLRSFAKVLDNLKRGIVAAYTGKSGLDADEVAGLMTDETWLSAEEAVSLGFADSVEEPLKVAALHKFDLTKFKDAPAAVGRKAPTTRGSQMTEKTQEQLDAEAEVARKAAENGETTEQTTKRVLAEAAARVTGIKAVCKLAGKPAKADAFIADAKMTVESVTAALEAEADEAAEKAGKDEVTGRNRTGNEKVVAIDTTAIYARLNASKGKRAAAA